MGIGETRLSTTTMASRPEWAMIGVHWPADPERPCMLIASDKWDEGEIQVQSGWQDVWYGYSLVPDDTRLIFKDARVTLRTGPENLVFVQAATWGECIEALFAQWQPREGQRRGIEGRREITRECSE